MSEKADGITIKIALTSCGTIKLVSDQSYVDKLNAQEARFAVRLYPEIPRPIDGCTLLQLLHTDELASRDDICAMMSRKVWTPAQREAVALHKSQRLRELVEAKRKSDEAATPRVLVDVED